jgi:hypothetical protein
MNVNERCFDPSGREIGLLEITINYLEFLRSNIYKKHVQAGTNNPPVPFSSSLQRRWRFLNLGKRDSWSGSFFPKIRATLPSLNIFEQVA